MFYAILVGMLIFASFFLSFVLVINIKETSTQQENQKYIDETKPLLPNSNKVCGLKKQWKMILKYGLIILLVLIMILVTALLLEG